MKYCNKIIDWNNIWNRTDDEKCMTEKIFSKGWNVVRPPFLLIFSFNLNKLCNCFHSNFFCFRLNLSLRKSFFFKHSFNKIVQTKILTNNYLYSYILNNQSYYELKEFNLRKLFLDQFFITKKMNKCMYAWAHVTCVYTSTHGGN